MHKVLRRRTGLGRLDLNELWAYRELLGFLAWRDITVRYKQTVIGVGWAFVRPFVTMVVLTIVFGYVAKLPSEGVPYPVLTFAALVPWQFFAAAFAETSGSIVGNGYMIQKIYFPRLILPIAGTAVATIDFLISFVFLILLMIGFRVMPSGRIFVLPLFVLLCIVFTLGLGLWFASLYVRFRDIRHLIPFIVQLGLYVSPVAFSSTVIPDKWRLLYSINPMASVIEGFRWSLLGTNSLYLPGVVLGATISVLLFVTGLMFFATSERKFADQL